MIVSFVLVLLHFLTIAVTAYLVTRENVSETGHLFARIANLQVLVFNTVLVSPIFNTLAVVFYCNPKSEYHEGEECYTPGYIAYCVLAAIVALWLVV